MKNKALLAVVLSFAGIILYAVVSFLLSEASVSDIFSATSIQAVSSVASDRQSGKLNINTATWQELTELDGIGEVLAKRIVAYRETNGAFTKPEQLMNVKGIGEKMLTAIINDITI